MAEITQIVLSCEKDWDMTIDARELNELTLHITLALEIQGIELNAESFKTMVRKNGDISRVLRGKSSEDLPCTSRSDSSPQTLTLVIGAIIFGNTMEGKRKGVDAEEARREGAQRDEAETYAAMKAVHRFGKVARPGSCDVAGFQRPISGLLQSSSVPRSLQR